VSKAQRPDASRAADGEREKRIPDAGFDGVTFAGSNGGRSTVPSVTVVVPTRNEAGNVEVLAERLEQVLPSDAEILFVDDSNDDTPAAIERARRRLDIPVRLIHRPPEERQGGLSGAVVAGIDDSRATWICVMDADLQHPPELLPELLARAERGDVDLVVASRYVASGSSNFAALRGLASKVSTVGARVLFPRRLRSVTDPMSGFFLVRRRAVDTASLQPRGFKILLEILARTARLRVTEVPFSFGERHAGESKASLSEGMAYLGQLAALRFGAMPRLFTRFGLVGASGLLVNMALFAAFLALGVHYVPAALLATQGSTVWLFLLTDRWVFRNRELARSTASRFVLYFLMNNLSLLVRVPLLLGLVDVLNLDPLLGNFVSLVALTLARFVVADSWIWKAGRREADGRATLALYDVHGLVGVESDVALPELERFSVPALGRPAQIRVRTGALSRKQSGLVELLASTGRHIRYDEGLGQFGFTVDIVGGRRTTVIASPLLRVSPHVLYTNVVEPILRWTFVRKGYALVHAACLSFDGEAVLVTARTDTGKTTTILKTLDACDCAFLSDDLTLLTPEGLVLTYPKPLTVSRHTVAAVRAPTLSWRQRLGLPLQSRIHSRSGRQFAFLLTKTRLPVATINAIVQLLVPPPKYHVDRLVPHVEFATQARVRHLVIIERGSDTVTSLTGPHAVSELLRNCEDAYGFPPYAEIAAFLHGNGDEDLHAAEQAIVTSALAETSATLVRSQTMEWWRHLVSTLGARTAASDPSPQQEVIGAAVSLSVAPE
jgi:glycosyltransferase involved in cell wall biosynthesis